MDKEMMRKLAAIVGDENEDNGSTGTKDELLTAFAVLDKKHELKPGDLVCWKPGMKNKKIPAYGAPMVVIANHSPALRNNEDNGGTPYFNEPLDISCGVIRDREETGRNILEFYYDSRRLEPYRD